MRPDTTLPIRADSVRDLRAKERQLWEVKGNAGEQGLWYSGHQGRLGAGSWGMGGCGLADIGTGNRWLGRASQAEGKARAKAPEDWECKSRLKGSWMVFFIWKVPFRR